ncbi:MAG: hypothetical protein M9890_11865, partial [Thermomicrobiales bacterium]|nr:hypothetical protein [Thermomicrobiales bacterium]
MSDQPPRRRRPARAGDTMPYPTVPSQRRPAQPPPPNPPSNWAQAGDTMQYPIVSSEPLQPPIPTTTAPTAEESGHGGKGIALAAVILMIGNILSRVLGLVREQTASYMFGAGDQMAAF